MQPTYLPWIGYFGMMDVVDRFVFLDSVQFDKRSWQQRNQIKTANGPAWLTVPVASKGRRDQLIRDVEIDDGLDFAEKHIRTIRQNYSKAPHFHEFADGLFDVLSTRHVHLADLSINLIALLNDFLSITTPVKRGSEMKSTGTKAGLLAGLCRESDADIFLSPPGSREYLFDSEAFEREDIAVRYFEFDHPTYPQCYGDFVSHMSIIDLLFNVGGESLSVIREGVGR
jgi:hypothetical protein